MSEQDPFSAEQNTSLGMLAKILGGAGILAAAGATAYVAKKIVENRQNEVQSEQGETDENL